MDLEYLINGITDGTVSIIELSVHTNALCNEIEPYKVKLDKKYDVVRLVRDKIGDRYDYIISVTERVN